MARRECPMCGRLEVPFYGPPKSEILLLGEYPGGEELKQGIPFIGNTGDILNKELAKIGIQMQSCRRGNLWQHGKYKDCDIEYHMERVVFEVMDHRKYVLMMGSDCIKAFLNKAVFDVSGLEVKVTLFPGDTRVIASPNPALLIHDTVGEFRLALRAFKGVIYD